jgi:hypothetical protein
MERQPELVKVTFPLGEGEARTTVSMGQLSIMDIKTLRETAVGKKLSVGELSELLENAPDNEFEGSVAVEWARGDLAGSTVVATRDAWLMFLEELRRVFGVEAKVELP